MILSQSQYLLHITFLLMKKFILGLGILFIGFGIVLIPSLYAIYSDNSGQEINTTVAQEPNQDPEDPSKEDPDKNKKKDKTIEATIDIHPNTLNFKSKGKWITVYIELPSEFDVASITLSTILLNNLVAAENHPSNIGDVDNNGNPDLMIKFKRALVKETLTLQDYTEITIKGELSNGLEFEGVDVIRLILY